MSTTTSKGIEAMSTTSMGEKYAARYQWLRSEEVNTDPRYYAFWNEWNAKLCREERMDALVDKWMSMDFCEHDNNAADCGICHGQFGVGA